LENKMRTNFKNFQKWGRVNFARLVGVGLGVAKSFWQVDRNLQG